MERLTDSEKVEKAQIVILGQHIKARLSLDLISFGYLNNKRRLGKDFEKIITRFRYLTPREHWIEIFFLTEEAMLAFVPTR